MSANTMSLPSSSARQSNFKSLAVPVAILALTIVLTPLSSFGQAIQSIRDLGTKTGDPINPQYVGLIAQGHDGNMYSTTPKGGTNGVGAAFRITPTGALTVIHDFTTAEGTPYSGFTLGTDGNFYGTTFNGGTSTNCSGGCGTIFKMDHDGNPTVLYNFTGGNDGKNPYAPPIEGTNGDYYGTTSAGGLDGLGTVYVITPTGSLKTLVQFNGTDGDQPIGPLVQAGDGNLYGTTSLGNNNCGNDNICATVFKVSPSGVFSQLHSFPFNAFHNFIFSAAGLVLGYDGNLYGTVVENGTAHGEIFEITTAGVFTDLYDFTAGNDGANPYAGLLLGTDGKFYGVSNANGVDGFGTVFDITSKPKFSLILPLNGTSGAFSSVPLFQNTNGIIYGEATQGGAVTNTGTFFKLTGLPVEKPFVSLLPHSGPVGETIGILGQGFTSTTTVSFNGIAATKVDVVDATYLTAVVPTGATLGYVTVTTPTGTLQSSRKFAVK